MCVYGVSLQVCLCVYNYLHACVCIIPVFYVVCHRVWEFVMCVGVCSCVMCEYVFV